MPYNPSVSYQGNRYLFEGISRGASTLRDTLLSLLTKSDQKKQLQTTLDTVYGKDPDRSKLGLNELQGQAVGLELKDRLQQTALGRALKQLQIGSALNQQNANTAMARAIQQATPPVTSTTTDLQGNAATPGNPFTVNVASQGRMTPSDLIRAISANPQAVNSAAGRQAINDFMRFGQAAQRGAPQFTQDPTGATVAYNPFTGQFEYNPIERINAQTAAKRQLQGPPAEPGSGPTMSKDRKFYWDTHLHAWKPLPQGKRDLVSEMTGGQESDATGAPAGNVQYSWENGALVRTPAEPTD